MDFHHSNPTEGRRFYMQGEFMKCDEDVYREFKGHRNICKENLCSIAVANRTRKPISRNLCGFLNTGKGGIVYMGLDDDGKILGILLSPYQQDHILLLVQDTFSRFYPPVDSTMYEVRFIPVARDEVEKTNFTSTVIDSERRKTPHMLRTAKHCWCDDEGNAKFNMGIIEKLYVVEVEVFPWNPNNKLALSSLTRVQPLFSNEERLYFVRRLAGLHQPSIEEVMQTAESDAYMYYATVARHVLSLKQREPIPRPSSSTTMKGEQNCNGDVERNGNAEDSIAKEPNL